MTGRAGREQAKGEPRTHANASDPPPHKSTARSQGVCPVTTLLCGEMSGISGIPGIHFEGGRLSPPDIKTRTPLVS
jgi:hypothetical protein